MGPMFTVRWEVKQADPISLNPFNNNVYNWYCDGYGIIINRVGLTNLWFVDLILFSSSVAEIQWVKNLMREGKLLYRSGMTLCNGPA